MPTASAVPTSDVDLWSNAALDDPFPAHETLREVGPVVRLDRYELVALTRFAGVRAALADWQTFSSAAGICVTPSSNTAMGVSILSSDPPEHTHLRKPLARQLSRSRLVAEGASIEALARGIVDDLLAGKRFDVVSELARPFSARALCLVAGIDDPAPDVLAHWGEQAFNVFGPADERLAAAGPALGHLRAHVAGLADAGALRTGGRAAELVALGRTDDIMKYTWPGIDTTATALASLLYLFARHPDQWEIVRSDPSRIPAALDEALRLHTPVQYFTRRTTTDVQVEGTDIAAGTRVLIMFGSANRDHRRFDDPHRFDVTRDASGHLAFGRGVHRCVGANLAALEVHRMIDLLARRVERFEIVGEPRWQRNGTLHGLNRLVVSASPADQ